MKAYSIVGVEVKLHLLLLRHIVIFNARRFLHACDPERTECHTAGRDYVAGGNRITTLRSTDCLELKY
jgi:hypothetical protein